MSKSHEDLVTLLMDANGPAHCWRAHVPGKAGVIDDHATQCKPCAADDNSRG